MLFHWNAFHQMKELENGVFAGAVIVPAEHFVGRSDYQQKRLRDEFQPR